MSRIDIDKQREAKIQSYFSNDTEVHIAHEQEKLDSLIETFKQRSHENSDKNNVNNYFGENKKLIDLLLWTMFLVLLISQNILLIF